MFYRKYAGCDGLNVGVLSDFLKRDVAAADRATFPLSSARCFKLIPLSRKRSHMVFGLFPFFGVFCPPLTV